MQVRAFAKSEGIDKYLGQRKLFIPITKIDAVRHEVWGVLAESVPDKQGEIFDYEGSKPFVKAWRDDFRKRTRGTGQPESFGNLRAMHESIAAGRFIAMEFDDEAEKVRVGAKVVDPNEWAKVKEGVYTGFSIGGDYVKRWMDPEGKGMRYIVDPFEGSLADNPAQFGSTFEVVKADGTSVRKNFAAYETGEDREGESMAKKHKHAFKIARLAKARKKKAKKQEEGSTPEGKLIMQLKGLIVENDLFEGDPALLTADAMILIIRDLLSPEESTEDPSTEPGEALPEETPTEPVAEVEGEEDDTEEEDPEATKVEEPDDESDDDAAKTEHGEEEKTVKVHKGKKSDTDKVGESATTSLMKIVTGEIAKVLGSETLSKTLAKSVGEGVSKALVKPFADLNGKLQKLLDRPASGGPAKRVVKTLGGELPLSPEDDISIEAVSKDFAAIEKNLSPQAQQEVRMALATAAMPRRAAAGG